MGEFKEIFWKTAHVLAACPLPQPRPLGTPFCTRTLAAVWHFAARKKPHERKDLKIKRSRRTFKTFAVLNCRRARRNGGKGCSWLSFFPRPLATKKEKPGPTENLNWKLNSMRLSIANVTLGKLWGQSWGTGTESGVGLSARLSLIPPARFAFFGFGWGFSLTVLHHTALVFPLCQLSAFFGHVPQRFF